MFFEGNEKRHEHLRRDYHDHILAVPCGDDLAIPEEVDFNADRCRVNTGGFQVGAELGAKNRCRVFRSILTRLPRRAARRLIGAFPARECAKTGCS